MSSRKLSPPLVIGEVEAPADGRTDLELKVGRLPTGTWVSIPVAVLRGRLPGPRIWLSAAIHGDELNGVEIVRRVVPRISLEHLRGTVIAVPIVNVFGFLHQDRYLPDRRDLNRSFPGSPRGSLTARLAHLFLTEIVQGSDYGIDLHTGSHHRTNYPQIRADLDDERTRTLAEAFRAPLTMHAGSRDGSLRQVASTLGCRVLLYEAGETLRFSHTSIQMGVRGVIRVLGALKMLPSSAMPRRRDPRTRKLGETRWLRAPRAGILLVEVQPGDVVDQGQTVARVADMFSENEKELRAPFPGVVVGATTNPITNRGDAVVHLGRIDDPA